MAAVAAPFALADLQKPEKESIIKTQITKRRQEGGNALLVAAAVCCCLVCCCCVLPAAGIAIYFVVR